MAAIEPGKILSDEDIKRAIRQLIQRTSQRIEAARNGSFTDFYVLSTGSHHLTRIYHPKSIDVFLSFLTDNIHRAQDRDYHHFAILALHGLGNTLVNTETKLRSSIIVEKWSDVLAWIEILVDVYIRGDASVRKATRVSGVLGYPFLMSKQTVIAAISYCVIGLNSVDILSRVIRKTPSFSDLFIYVWLQEEPSPPEVPNATEAVSYVFREIHRCKDAAIGGPATRSREQSINASLFEPILKAANGDIDFIADVLTSRLRATLKHFNIKATNIHTLIIMFILDTPDGVISKYFFDKGCLRLALRCMRKVWDYSEGGTKSDQDVQEVLAQCFIIIRFYTDLGTPIEGAMAAALRHGLFFVLVYLQDRKPERIFGSSFVAPFPSDILFETVRSHLCILSCLRLVGSSMERFPSIKVIQKTMAEKRYLEEWNEFQGQFLVSSVVHAFMKLWPGTGEFCANMNCRALDKQVTLRRCSGCENTRFCSKECQREGWRDGHKDVCSRIKQRRNSFGEINLKQTDEDFLKRLAQFEIRRHIRGLRSIAEKRFPNRRFEEMGFHVNFTEPPKLILDVQPHETFDRVNSESWYVEYDEDRVMDGTFRFIIVHYPCGGQRLSHIPLNSSGVTPSVFLAPPSYKSWMNTKGAKTRPAAYDPSGERLQCDYDEIDELVKTVRCFIQREDKFSVPGRSLNENSQLVMMLRLICSKYEGKPMWDGDLLRDTIEMRVKHESWPFTEKTIYSGHTGSPQRHLI